MLDTVTHDAKLGDFLVDTDDDMGEPTADDDVSVAEADSKKPDTSPGPEKSKNDVPVQQPMNVTWNNNANDLDQSRDLTTESEDTMKIDTVAKNINDGVSANIDKNCDTEANPKQDNTTSLNAVTVTNEPVISPTDVKDTDPEENKTDTSPVASDRQIDEQSNGTKSGPSPSNETAVDTTTGHVATVTAVTTNDDSHESPEKSDIVEPAATTPGRKTTTPSLPDATDNDVALVTPTVTVSKLLAKPINAKATNNAKAFSRALTMNKGPAIKKQPPKEDAKIHGKAKERVVVPRIIWDYNVVIFQILTGVAAKPTYLNPSVQSWNDKDKINKVLKPVIDTFVRECQDGKPKVFGASNQLKSFAPVYIWSDIDIARWKETADPDKACLDDMYDRAKKIADALQEDLENSTRTDPMTGDEIPSYRYGRDAKFVPMKAITVMESANSDEKAHLTWWMPLVDALRLVVLTYGIKNINVMTNGEETEKQFASMIFGKEKFDDNQKTMITNILARINNSEIVIMND